MPDDATPQKPRRGRAGAGRPPHIPTPETRQIVVTLSGLGQPQPAIARRIGIAERTLRRIYRDELDRGADEANTQVVQSIWNAAVGVRLAERDGVIVRERVEPNMTAAIYWTKTRMGWKETPQTLHHVGNIDLNYATPEDKEREIEALIRRRSAAIAARREEDPVPDSPSGLVH